MTVAQTTQAMDSFGVTGWPHVLVVDDDAAFCAAPKRALSREHSIPASVP
jgi:hypothetical protein